MLDLEEEILMKFVPYGTSAIESCSAVPCCALLCCSVPCYSSDSRICYAVHVVLSTVSCTRSTVHVTLRVLIL